MSAYPAPQPYPVGQAYPAPPQGAYPTAPPAGTSPYPNEHQTYPNSHYGAPASYGQTSGHASGVYPAPSGAYPAPNGGAYPAPTDCGAPVAYPSPVVQQVVVAPPPPVAPLFVVDSQRRSTQQPGVLVYSAKFSEQRLTCLYCVQSWPFCSACCTDTARMAKLTHFDVYTNAVVFSKPHFIAHTCDGCCDHHAVGTVRYYDHPVFDQAVTSNGLCYGHVYACCACQGSFGEQITFMNTCCANCCCNCSGLQHYTGLCNCNSGCGANETIFGLKEDEGRRLAAIINEQASIFRANPNQYRLDSLVANGVDTKYV